MERIHLEFPSPHPINQTLENNFVLLQYTTHTFKKGPIKHKHAPKEEFFEYSERMAKQVEKQYITSKNNRKSSSDRQNKSEIRKHLLNDNYPEKSWE